MPLPEQGRFPKGEGKDSPSAATDGGRGVKSIHNAAGDGDRTH